MFALVMLDVVRKENEIRIRDAEKARRALTHSRTGRQPRAVKSLLSRVARG